MIIDQLVPVPDTGSRILLSDARVQIARPKADVQQPPVPLGAPVSEVGLHAQDHEHMREHTSMQVACACARCVLEHDDVVDAVHAVCLMPCSMPRSMPYAWCHAWYHIIDADDLLVAMFDAMP